MRNIIILKLIPIYRIKSTITKHLLNPFSHNLVWPIIGQLNFIEPLK